MRRKAAIGFLALAAVVVLGVSAAEAGAKIKIGEDSEIDVGFRVQALFTATDRDIDNTDGQTLLESENAFLIRRGRLRLGAKVGKYVEAFLQTEFSEQGTANAVGGEVRMIDAFIKVKVNPRLHIIAGENMAPATRQNLTSSGGLMAIDRPSIANKTLTWGLRGKHNFTIDTTPTSGASLTATDSPRTGIFGKVGVRDLGVTLFGSGDFNDKTHGKYYIGIYDGINAQGYDSERYSGRVQINFFDAEPGFYGLSTYLGGKKTVGVGVSFDQQGDVAIDGAGGVFDYSQVAFDIFADVPAGAGHLTAEAGFQSMDLDGFAPAAEGDGFYVQLGFLAPNKKIQPWVLYETWDSDSTTTAGNYDIMRLGLSYFLKGHNANVKFGVEKFDADFTLDAAGEDSITSFVVGLYTTY